MGLAGKLRWTTHKIFRECVRQGKDAVQGWAARGRAGWEDVQDAARPGQPAKISGKQAAKHRRVIENDPSVTLARLAAQYWVVRQTIVNTAHPSGLTPVRCSADSGSARSRRWPGRCGRQSNRAGWPRGHNTETGQASRCSAAGHHQTLLQLALTPQVSHAGYPHRLPEGSTRPGVCLRQIKGPAGNVLKVYAEFIYCYRGNIHRRTEAMLNVDGKMTKY